MSESSGRAMTRRGFGGLSARALAAGFAGPTLLSDLARGGRIPANDQITLGFVGMGIRARNLMQGAGWLKNEKIRVLAVCDVDSTRREHRQNMVNEAYANSDCEAYLDYHELLAREDIDAVCIATPDHWHANMVLDACRAGKDIYCEKPLTLTIGEAKACIDAVRKADRVFQTGSQQRTEYDHKFVTACEYVRSGRIGKLLNVNVGVGDPASWCDLGGEQVESGLDWDRWLGPAPWRAYHSELSPRGVHNHYPRWRAYREYSGGYFTDMGAHHYDIAQWGLGMDESGPIRVELPEGPREPMRGARLVYENGAVVTHGGPSGTTFIGDGGMIHVDRGRLISTPGSILEEPLGDEDERLPRHPNHLSNWIDCIRSRERPVCDVEVGARTITCCHLVNLAYWNGRDLAWDPKRWRFERDNDALLHYRRREGYELPDA